VPQGAPLNACCKADLERLYQLLLLQYGGAESLLQTEALRIATTVDAGLLEDYLNLTHLEVRVFDSKKVPEACLFHLTCPSCGARSAIVVLNAAFLLGLWRVQMVLLSMMTEVRTEQSGRTVIQWRRPDKDDLAQLDTACDSYFGDRRITSAGIKGLLAKTSKAPETIRARIEDAVTTAQLWIVAHEAAHFVQDQEPLWSRADFARNPRQLARSYLAKEGAPTELAKDWEVELAADLQATQILTLALCEEIEKKTSDHRLVRRSAVSRVAAGACAALLAIDLAVICKQRGQDQHHSHPNCAYRWELIAYWLAATANLHPDVIFDIAQVQILAGQVLFDEWQSARGHT
jgi:hypothetical protein